MNDAYAFEEFEVTHGIVLSGRALTCLALNLGNHYLRGIMQKRVISENFQVSSLFTRDIKFYEF